MAFNTPLTPSPELAAVVGPDPISRPRAVQKFWEYVKEHGLQDQSNKRMINTDVKLAALFEDGPGQVSMFQVAGMIGRHLSNG